MIQSCCVLLVHHIFSCSVFLSVAHSLRYGIWEVLLIYFATNWKENWMESVMCSCSGLAQTVSENTKVKNRPFRCLQTYKFYPYISILSYGCKLRNLTYFGLFHRFQNPPPDSASLSECQMSFLIQMREQSVQWEECLECFHVPERMRLAIWHANERQVLAILSNERMGSMIEFFW